MKQTALDLNLSLKKTRKREFLEQMDQVVPWSGAGRTHSTVLSRGQERQATLFLADHAAHPLHAAVVHAV